MARHVEWEIKVTKLCNLRCAYCYEYEELGDPRRLSLAQWRAIIESARWYHETLARRNPDEPVSTRFVWHGGEASVLPVRYYEEVLDLQREVLGGIDYANHVATNLFRIRSDLLALWDRERFVVAVSYDGVRGARVAHGGKDSNAVVETNLKRLLSTPRTIGVNSVLTAVNLPHLIEIYRRLSDLAHNSAGTLYWNLIPVHSAAADHPRTAPYQLDPAATVSGLLELFRYWLDDPWPISISPLQQHYLAAVRKLLGAPERRFPRREFGETSLMINTDGHLYPFRDAYDRAKSLGCLFERPLRLLIEESAYASSLERTEHDTAELCGGCMYDGHCNHAALIHGHRGREGERCGLTFALLQAIEAEVRDRGIIALVHHAGPQSAPNHQFLFPNRSLTPTPTGVSRFDPPRPPGRPGP
jgi:uncharacterized protein